MPAQKLSTAQTAPAYSIVGTYSDSAEGEFVRHVAILREETHLQRGQLVPVFHMGPPLVAGERTRKTPRAELECIAHLVGSVPLDLDGTEGIKDWLAKIDKQEMPENPFRRYIVRPHADWYLAPETERRLYRRFSCAGFVIDCYRHIEVLLVDTDEQGLPEVDLGMLVRAYPLLEQEEVVLQRLTRTRADPGLTRDDLGVPGDGPWRIVLAGYIFHALDRVTKETPRPVAYSPNGVADAHFPHGCP